MSARGLFGSGSSSSSSIAVGVGGVALVQPSAGQQSHTFSQTDLSGPNATRSPASSGSGESWRSGTVGASLTDVGACLPGRRSGHVGQCGGCGNSRSQCWSGGSARRRCSPTGRRRSSEPQSWSAPPPGWTQRWRRTRRKKSTAAASFS